MKQFRDLTKFLEAGGKAWTVNNGEVIVESVHDCYDFSITTKDGCTYTKDGRKFSNDKYPILFLKNPNINYDYEPEPEIDFSKLPHNVKCIVSEYDDFKEEYIRYFSDYLTNAESRFVFYGDGHKKNTAYGISAWKYCKLHPDIEVKKEWLV